ncbi:MAG TPA: hydantoinase B/oxoprolinase family protein [Candidatus Limnocylindria bacterium]|nr:hydantoinase B/oxoprolinase family protein [Candidatus Limnocylindria bacterium]
MIHGELSPITVEVVRNALYAIAEEMSVIVMRSARSPLLKEAGDLSSALTDAQGRLIAQGRDIPMHMGVMGFTVKEFLKRVPAERLREGDVWFLNLPEVGGNHLPDVKAVRPVFFEGRLAAFAINLAHWADIGGAVPGSYVPSATECYAEGLRIAPIRLFSAAGPDREKIDFVLSNVRGRDEREGDMFAQFAANDVAARRLHDLFARYGAATTTACFERFHAESEAQMRAALAALPDGVWEGEDWLDDDGVEDRRLRIHVRIDKRGEEATFDFSGSDAQARGPVNTTYFIACSSVYYAMKALVAPDVPPNEGCYRPLHVIVPQGSVLRADPDRPVVGGNHETSQRVVDAIVKALAPVLPHRVPAGGPTTSGLLIFGARYPDGRWAVLYEVHGGGEGATASKDGASAVRVHMSNVMNTPVEVIEGEYPVMVEEQALRAGSGGDGAHRGGLGFRRAYRIMADDVTLTSMIERRLVPPYGLAGGSDALTFRLTLNPGTAAARVLRGKDTVALREGDLVLIETCGGGGYGPPAERPDALRAQDRLEDDRT